MLFININTLFGVEPDTVFPAQNGIDTLIVNDLQDTLITPAIIVRDSLVQIHLSSLISEKVNNTINKNEFFRNDYRYTADILRVSPFTFIRDLGSIGKSEGFSLYGGGFGNISFVEDGMILNNRVKNNFDLNFVNSETIDSIEIVSPARGFLYGIDNNLTAVNIISNDFLSRTPYSRLKFYEAPYGEAMFDGTFNAYVYRNVNLYFNFNNRIYGPRFINDEYANWNAKVRVKYFASPVINFIGTYSAHFSEAQLNGGVDYNNLLNTSLQPNTVLYNRQFAPVHQPERYEKVNLHNFDLSVLHKLSDDFYGGITLYSKYYLSRAGNDYIDSIRINTKEEIKTFGAVARQHFKTGLFNLRLEGMIEKVDFLMKPDFYIPELDYFGEITYSLDGYKSAFSAIASYSLFDDNFTHSVFYKYSNLIDKNHRNGVGTDLQLILFDKMKIYLGTSVYETRESEWRTVIDGKIQFENKFLSAGLNYFYYTNMFTNNFIGTLPYSHLSFYQQQSFSRLTDISGIGGDIKLQIWKILIEARTAYYYDVKENTTYTRLPSFAASGGIYFQSILFNDNLDLKTGFNIKSGGEQRYFYINQQSQVQVPAYFTIDFFAAAEIQKSAFLYFVFENLLDRQYYITPFYPMHERGIRFGAAWEFLN